MMATKHQIERAITSHEMDIVDCEDRIDGYHIQIGEAEEQIEDLEEEIERLTDAVSDLRLLLDGDGDEVEIEVKPSLRMELVIEEMREHPPQSLDEWRQYNQRYEAAALQAITGVAR